jgi:2'-5' RNA ligase
MPEPERWALAPSARVFFALWPGAEVRQALMHVGLKMHRQVQGKLTREESVHMTLLFLGETPTERLEALTRLAAGIAFEPFTLSLEQADCWKHNKIAWVAPLETPPALARLVSALEQRAAAQGFRFDRRPFAAHVTLLRKARCGPLDLQMPCIRWEVRDFALVRSELGSNGSRYSLIGRWPPQAVANV